MGTAELMCAMEFVMVFCLFIISISLDSVASEIRSTMNELKSKLEKDRY